MEDIQELLLVHQAISGCSGIKSWRSCLQNCNCKEINEPDLFAELYRKYGHEFLGCTDQIYLLGLAIDYKDTFCYHKISFTVLQNINIWS